MFVRNIEIPLIAKSGGIAVKIENESRNNDDFGNRWVQIGSRFAVNQKASAHENWKQKL